MTRIRTLVLVVVLIGVMVAIHALGVALNYHRYANDVVEELTYFPSGRFLQVASLGYEMFASDLLWLKGIQYYGEHRRTDRYYPLADHIFSVITDLDPQFLGAYRFGAFVLAQDMGVPQAGIELLKKGMHSNPGVWQLPFDLGFLYFTSVADNAKAAHYFRMASGFDGAPDISKRFSAFAYRKAGRTDLALSLWEEIYRSSINSIMRESALYAIRSIRLEQIGDMLAELVERYHSETGRFPTDLSELVKVGLAKSVPTDPFGGRYFLEPEAKQVLSTTKVVEEAGRMKGYLERKINQYAEMTGHYPSSISALKTEGLIAEIPIVAGAVMHYDTAGGTVEYVFLWERME